MLYQESENIELKSSFGEWKEIIITLAAFANKNGGMVIVGLDIDGKPLHIEFGKNTIEDFVNKLKNHTDPTLYPSINLKTFGLGEIVEISVPQSDYKPVFAFERAWIRVGKSNVKASTDKLRELFVRYEQPDFDSQLLNDSTDIEFDKQWISKIEAKGGNLPEKITTAIYLCFNRANTKYPQAIVKAARFKGDKPVVFIDSSDFKGGLLSITDEIIAFIKKNIRLA